MDNSSHRRRRNNNMIENNNNDVDDFIIKNESIISKNLFTNNGKNGNRSSSNYYYEEQKPLIIVPSESGSIPIQDYTGTFKPLLLQQLQSDDDSSINRLSTFKNIDDNRNLLDRNNNNNYFYDNSENDNRSKYVVTTSTISPSGISDLSSKEMNEYDDNYRNYDDDYYRQKYNDENDDNNSYNNQPQITSYMETAKNIWDIFTAINAAWSAISDKQQNSIDNNQYNSRKFNENLTSESTTTENNENYLDDERSKRYTNYTNDKSILDTDIHSSSTDVAISEGRYIKGDPLKGYYDFVITEGSYKFWAAFQFATAILIIYSTFAAIYYSKVNPLVGDYDYVDYLGGGRSLSSNDVTDDDDDTDFIDIPYSESQPKSSLSSLSNNDNSKNSKTFLSSIVEKTVGNSGDWIPKMGYTLKFILDAIDKIPQ